MNRAEWWAYRPAPPDYDTGGPEIRSDGFDATVLGVLKVIGIMCILPFWAMAWFIVRFVRV